jgi:hypothetical protein
MSPFFAQRKMQGGCWYGMRYRQPIPPSPALGRQLAEWRQPLDEDPAVEEAVMRMLKTVDRCLQREQPQQNHS